MRLIGQVGADYRGVGAVALGQHRPVGDPAALRILRGVPEARGLRAVAGLGTVVIEDDPQAQRPGLGHDLVHELQAVQSL